MILLVGKAGWGVSLPVAVEVARDVRLGRRGVTVVSSRRGGVRIGAPLIHREASGAIREPALKGIDVQTEKSTLGEQRGRARELLWSQSLHADSGDNDSQHEEGNEDRLEGEAGSARDEYSSGLSDA